MSKVKFGSSAKRRVYSLLSGNAMSVPVVGAVLLAVATSGPVSTKGQRQLRCTNMSPTPKVFLTVELRPEHEYPKLHLWLGRSRMDVADEKNSGTDTDTEDSE